MPYKYNFNRCHLLILNSYNNNNMRIHRVYCKSVSGPNTKFALDNTESHHLIKALRLKEGRVVEVFDGNGSSASCEIVLLNNNKCELERISEVNKDNKPHRTLTNVIPFIKTNNFNGLINEKINTINPKIKLDLNDVNFKLNIPNFEFLITTADPKVSINNKKIELETLKFNLKIFE